MVSLFLLFLFVAFWLSSRFGATTETGAHTNNESFLKNQLREAKCERE